MTAVHEMLSGDTYVDNEGDVKPYADVAADLDAHPPTDAFITQGMANLDAWRQEQLVVEQAERQAREQKLADDALKNAGVYVTLEEHKQTQRNLIEVTADIAQYEGGENGGYTRKDFKDRYKSKSDSVETGARINHKKLVNQTIPELYKADELITAGFSKEDVYDDITQMRGELKSKFGRGKKNARAKARADLL